MKRERFFGLAFVLAITLMPLIAFIAPRFLAFWPGLTGLALLSFYRFSFGFWPDVPKKTLEFILIIVALAGLSSFWALDSDFAVYRTVNIALVLLPGAAFLSVAQSIPLPVIRPYLKIVPLVFFITVLAVTIEMIADYPLYRLLSKLFSDGEMSSSDLNRSVIALLAELFVMIGIAKLEYGWKMVAGLVCVFVLALFFTDSQSAQLGFTLALVCFFAFPYRYEKAWLFLAVFLTLLVFLAPFLAPFLYSNFSASIAEMPFLGQGNGFGAQRLEIWDAVGRYALQNPLYGFGVEATRAVDDFDMGQVYRKTLTVLHPHNFALQLWIEFGVMGVCLAGAFFTLLLRNLKRCNLMQARMALASFAILFVPASFGYGLWQSWFLGLIIFTIALVKLTMRLYQNREIAHL